MISKDQSGTQTECIKTCSALYSTKSSLSDTAFSTACFESAETVKMAWIVFCPPSSSDSSYMKRQAISWALFGAKPPGPSRTVIPCSDELLNCSSQSLGTPSRTMGHDSHEERSSAQRLEEFDELTWGSEGTPPRRTMSEAPPRTPMQQGRKSILSWTQHVVPFKGSIWKVLPLTQRTRRSLFLHFNSKASSDSRTVL